ncbi:MAG: hypothetical protein ACQEWF_10805 [Bacillota bacterium]
METTKGYLVMNMKAKRWNEESELLIKIVLDCEVTVEINLLFE